MIKKGQEGFTIVELLGVITILGILALVSFSALDSINKNDKKKAYDIQINGILESAISYVPTSDITLPTGTSEICLSLNQLHEEGVIKEAIENPKTGEKFDMDNVKVCIKKVQDTNFQNTLPENSYAYDGNYIYYMEGVE